jgi:hypothetical protein
MMLPLSTGHFPPARIYALQMDIFGHRHRKLLISRPPEPAIRFSRDS